MDAEAWFFDLGGTLVAVEGDEIALDAAGRLRPLPGAIEALRRLRGRRVFVVSNQAGVAQGTITAMRAYGFIEQLNRLTEGAITDFRFAMHAPEAGSDWRKPGPGMIRDLALVYRLDPGRCVMVGDSESDRLCAERAGIGRFVRAADFLAADDPDCFRAADPDQVSG
jgi:histidinol-phosphate phosphatase family protein